MVFGFFLVLLEGGEDVLHEVVGTLEAGGGGAEDDDVALFCHSGFAISGGRGEGEGRGDESGKSNCCIVSWSLEMGLRWYISFLYHSGYIHGR
jgi:hypothetical protein